jgi:predicted nucleic acid-binding protein
MVRRIVFVDTVAWVALANENDNLHEAAISERRKLAREKVRFVTTNFVIDESITLIRSRTNHANAVAFGEMIRQSKTINVVHISRELEEEAWQLFKQFYDKEFSFTDCTSFVVMRREGIWECFTNDHHFEQMGYRKLL